MAGRWAQLAVDAHIARAIDYRKPIKNFIEKAIHDRLELKRFVDAAKLFPCAGNDEKTVIYMPANISNNLREELFPWDNLHKNTAKPKRTLKQKLDRLKALEKVRQ